MSLRKPKKRLVTLLFFSFSLLPELAIEMVGMDIQVQWYLGLHTLQVKDSANPEILPQGMNRCSTGNYQNEEQAVSFPAYKALHISALKQNGLLQSLSATPNGCREADISEEVLRAREEWDSVANIHSEGIVERPLGPIPLISFNEALQYFQTADLSDCRKKIQPTVRRRGLAAVAHFLFGPPRLHQQLQSERDLALAIAQCGLDNNEKVHMRILQTIYKKLTGSRFDCARYGAHWEDLGFQEFPFLCDVCQYYSYCNPCAEGRTPFQQNEMFLGKQKHALSDGNASLCQPIWSDITEPDRPEV
ncbi:ELMO domain-containing protein 3 isoform X5 [Podarcis muralis]